MGGLVLHGAEHIREGFVEAGHALVRQNVWDVSDEIADLVASKRAVDPKALADPAVDLASLSRP